MPEPRPRAETAALPADFPALVAFVEARKEISLLAHLTQHVRLVAYQPGRLEIALTENAPQDLSQRLVRFLNDATATRWAVIVSNARGQPTLAEQATAAVRAERQALMEDPLVQAVLETFPEAQIRARRSLERPPAAPAADEQDIEDE